MNKQYYLDNWDMYWQSYNNLNPDLAKNGIHSKRALYNHYNMRGYIENRSIENKVIENKVIEHHTITKSEIHQPTSVILTFEMFKEKI